MDREMLAREMLAIARDLVAMEFPSQEAMDKYLKDHPDADRSMHKVKRKAPGKWQKFKNKLEDVKDDVGQFLIDTVAP